MCHSLILGSMYRYKISLSNRAKSVIDGIARATHNTRSATIVALVQGDIDLSHFEDLRPPYPVTKPEIAHANARAHVWVHSRTQEPFEALHTYSVALGVPRGSVIQVLLWPLLIPAPPCATNGVSPYWIRTGCTRWDGDQVWSPGISAILSASQD